MYWISPLSYAVRAIVVNEMNTDDWNTLVKMEGGGFEALGIYAMEGRGMQTQTWCVMHWCMCARDQEVLDKASAIYHTSCMRHAGTWMQRECAMGVMQPQTWRGCAGARDAIQ